MRATQLVRERLGVVADFTLKIENEQDENGESINANIIWLRFPKPQGLESPSVEAKAYLPKVPNERLIVYAPGSPGGDCKTFEAKHAKALVEAGYTLITLRHNGLGIGMEKTPNFFNAPQRIALMERSGKQYLGQGTESDKPRGTIGPIACSNRPQ